MPYAQIVDCVNYMPERVVKNADIIPSADMNGSTQPATAPTGGSAVESNAFFRGIRERRFASPQYSSGDLGVLASKKVLERNGVDPESIDLIITCCVLTDLLANGIGGDIQRRIGAKKANFLNVDTNCTSWIAALNVARSFIESGLYKRILVVTVTNFVSRLKDFQKFKGSWVLGDGASATLMVEGPSPTILAIEEKSIGDLYGQMRLEPAPTKDGCYKQYWEGNTEPLTVNFSQDLLDKIRETATQGIPAAVKRILEQSDLALDDIDLLLTHQPNRLFIDGWRQALGIHPPRAHDTLEIYGNLFMGSIPVTLGDAIDKGMVKRGSVIVAATFANAGDHISALAMRWNSPTKHRAVGGGIRPFGNLTPEPTAVSTNGIRPFGNLTPQPPAVSTNGIRPFGNLTPQPPAVSTNGSASYSNDIASNGSAKSAAVPGAPVPFGASSSARLPVVSATGPTSTPSSTAAAATQGALPMSANNSEPFRREDLVTRGVDINKIPGVVNCFLPSFASAMQEIAELTKPTYTAEEMFGKQTTLMEHIEVPIEMAFEYAANLYSLEEYSATVRNLEHLGGGLYRGLDTLGAYASIYLKLEVFKDSKCVDYLCAWDQPHEMWMRYHWRFFDAMPLIGKIGTVLLWTNFRHPYYDKASPAPPYVAEGRAMPDRLWVGDFYHQFYAAHTLEARNFKRILEHRLKKT